MGTHEMEKIADVEVYIPTGGAIDTAPNKLARGLKTIRGARRGDARRNALARR